MDAKQWDERYSESGFMYGTEPNEFLVSVADRIPTGPVLMLGDGEGRNGVYLAGRGYEVVSVDQSTVALEKARGLARERGVKIETRQADLREFVVDAGSWAGIVSIFCHLPPAIRLPLHAKVVRGLRIGGVFVLEAYTPAQLGRGTGGPSAVEMLLPLDNLKGELPGLEFVHAQELERVVREGAYHTGMASVVQAVGRRLT